GPGASAPRRRARRPDGPARGVGPLPPASARPRGVAARGARAGRDPDIHGAPPRPGRLRHQRRGLALRPLPALGGPEPGQVRWDCGTRINALARYNVTANAIMLSAATRMIDSTPRGKEVHEQTGKWPSELAAGTERDPENVAPLVVYLASDDA